HTDLDRNFFGVARVKPQDSARLITSLALQASEGLHNLRMIRLIELALVIRRDNVDFTNITPSRWLCPAVLMTNRLQPGVIPANFIAACGDVSPRGLISVLNDLTPATAHRVGPSSAEERWMFAASPREKMGRALEMLWPAPAGRSL